MNEREELAALRRLAELEAKASRGKAYNPAEGMSTGELLLAGVGKGMTDLARGAGQLFGRVSQADIDEAKRLDAALVDTTAGSIGNVVGKVAVGVPAAFIPGANTLAGAAAVGGLQGLLEPTATGESTLKNVGVGAAAGSGGVLAGRLLAAGYQGVKGLVQPFYQGGQQKIAGRVLNRFAADPAALASANGGKTATGASPTLAEATRDPGIAALQRSIEQQDPQIAAALAQRAAENNAARVGVLQSLAGDETKRAAAEAAREAVSKPIYDKALAQTIELDPEITALMSRPSVQSALSRAAAYAKEQGRAFGLSPAKEVPASLVLDASGSPMVAASKVPAKITGQTLHDLKMGMDALLKDPNSGIVGAEADAVRGTRASLLRWLESKIPEYGNARKAYAAGTKPINQMDVGQRLLDKTTGAMRDLGGNQRLQANAFARAMNDEQGLVRKATGFKGVNALDDVLEPGQVQMLNALRGELELAANLANAANGPGSQTAKSLASQNLLRQIIGPTGMPQSWAESAMLQTALRPVDFAMKAAEPKIQNQLLEAFLDPAKAKALVKAAETKAIDPRLARILPLLQQAATQSVPAAAVSR